MTAIGPFPRSPDPTRRTTSRLGKRGPKRLRTPKTMWDCVQVTSSPRVLPGTPRTITRPKVSTRRISIPTSLSTNWICLAARMICGCRRIRMWSSSESTRIAAIPGPRPAAPLFDMLRGNTRWRKNNDSQGTSPVGAQEKRSGRSPFRRQTLRPCCLTFLLFPTPTHLTPRSFETSQLNHIRQCPERRANQHNSHS